MSNCSNESSKGCFVCVCWRGEVSLALVLSAGTDNWYWLPSGYHPAVSPPRSHCYHSLSPGASCMAVESTLGTREAPTNRGEPKTRHLVHSTSPALASTTRLNVLNATFAPSDLEFTRMYSYIEGQALSREGQQAPP